MEKIPLRIRVLAWIINRLGLGNVAMRLISGKPNPAVLLITRDGVPEVYHVFTWGGAWDRLKPLMRDMDPEKDRAYYYEFIKTDAKFPLDTEMTLVDDFEIVRPRFGRKAG